MIDAKDLVNLSQGMKYSDDEIIDGLLQNPDIRDFVMSHDLTQKQVENSLLKLMEYNKDTHISDDGIKESISVPGFVMELKMDGDEIITPFVRVRKLKTRKIKCFNVPNELTNASFADFSVSNEARKKAYRIAKMFCQNFKTPDQLKGLYMFGPFRSGKTYLASAIANELADKGHDVIEIYYPELSAMVKNTFDDSSEYTAYNMTEELKSCDLLILDDFGGENLNQYIRDEILGVVLNYRMVKNKPVIFTSNVPRDRLADTALRKDGSEAERLKSQRILERIKEMTDVVVFTEKFTNEELF